MWQFRIPRDDLHDEAWLKDEPAELLHICRPVPFLEAVERRDKEGSSEYCGYVRDDSNKVSDLTSLRCAKCKRRMPEAAAKKGLMQYKMHKLGRNR